MKWLIVLALALSTGCDRGSAATTDKAGDAAAKGGAAGAPGAGGPGAVRRPMSVVLGPNDVIAVRKGTIESSVAVSGNLQPIEQIDVRARVEGNILSVNVREGTRVARGQLLASFEDATQQGDRASAEADVESAVRPGNSSSHRHSSRAKLRDAHGDHARQTPVVAGVQAPPSYRLDGGTHDGGVQPSTAGHARRHE